MEASVPIRRIADPRRSDPIPMGSERATALVRERPEQFGALITEERRKLLGLVRVADDSQARRLADRKSVV
jgi:hypothetical protein